MFNILTKCRENEEIYSFGKVTENLDNNRIRVEYDGVNYVLENIVSAFEKDVWVRFYGFYNGMTISVSYIEALPGVDINLLVNVANRINQS